MKPAIGRAAPLMTAVLATAAATIVSTWPLARDAGHSTVASGEVFLTAWQLNWFQQALLTQPLAWADANIFFPYSQAVTFNDLLLTHALVTLPAYWTTSPVLALNLALIGGIVLCAACAYWLIDEVTGDRWSSAVGATLFAVAPFRFLHIAHVSIAAAWAVPLFFFLLLRYLRTPSWPGAMTAVVSGLAVAWSSLYHAAFVAPLLPLVLVFGFRRGRNIRAWVPLLATGSAALLVLAWTLIPYLTTMRSFGVAAAPEDLLRYGADLSSLGQKPDFLASAGRNDGIDPEARLYPGAALSVLSAAAMAIGLVAIRHLHGWRRTAAWTAAGAVAVAAAGFLASPPVALHGVWSASLLTLIWLTPVGALAGLAVATPRGATGPGAAIGFGLAGAAVAFVLALGPQARYLTDVIGPAPYAVLSAMSSVFEGTRVPARFGGLALLFLAMAASGTLAWVGRTRFGQRLHARPALAAVALVVCGLELPVPPLPVGLPLVDVPDVRAPVYRWLADQPRRSAVLELPDWGGNVGVPWQNRDWRALRYMLASKQHGQPLVNGTGRVEPFLWQRLQTVQIWSDDFFQIVVSYFPLDYVLVHDEGFPTAERAAIHDRLNRSDSNWRRVFRAGPSGVYTVDRSSGRGPIVDRLMLRNRLSPTAMITASVRVSPADESVTADESRVELLVDGRRVDTWAVSDSWLEIRTSATVDPDAPAIYHESCVAGRAPCRGWPLAGVLLRWQPADDAPVTVEIRDLSVESAPGP